VRQEASHWQDPKRSHSKNAKSGITEQGFSFQDQPCGSPQNNFRKVAYHLQKGDETDHLEDSYDNEVSRICKIDYGQPNDNNASLAST